VSWVHFEQIGIEGKWLSVTLCAAASGIVASELIRKSAVFREILQTPPKLIDS
jgi:hypothetical protein